MNLQDTIKLMSSDSYKDRFIAEYRQIIIRASALEDMLHGYREGTLDFEPECSYGLLKAQLSSMLSYISILEERASIENIKLR